MTVVVIHAVVWAVGSCLLVLGWLMAGGSTAVLEAPFTGAREHGFWPLWIIVGWGGLLALHAGITIPIAVKVRRRRRRKRREGAAPSQREGKTWLAAMFTDITGSTALTAQLGDDAWSELIAAHRRTVRELARAHGGTEVGTQGDGTLLRFPSPAQAVDCAVALQRRLDEERSDGTAVPPVRIGIHAGQAVAQDGDVLGRMVNLAARVADAAGPHEILVTEPVADHASPASAFDDRGLQELKGFDAPRHVLAVRWR